MSTVSCAVAFGAPGLRGAGTTTAHALCRTRCGLASSPPGCYVLRFLKSHEIAGLLSSKQRHLHQLMLDSAFGQRVEPDSQ